MEDQVDNGTMDRRGLLWRGGEIARAFYEILRHEVGGGNPALAAEEQERLRGHYPVMMTPQRNPPELAATIYAERRKVPVTAILETGGAAALDAGCGYGSESFLFAACGARVLAVDADAEKIQIAQKRRAYFEEATGRALDITFVTRDLDAYAPEGGDLSLTWMASVLAALPRQADFLVRARAATRPGGQLMVSDMNLWNPLFVAGEYRRRREAARRNTAFAREQDFGAMFARRGREGARYFVENGETFDDVQFFQPRTLAGLYRATGWELRAFYFSGYVPPFLARRGGTGLETLFAQLPLVSQMGYFYLGVGVK